jgi:hypothetical protein
MCPAVVLWAEMCAGQGPLRDARAELKKIGCLAVRAGGWLGVGAVLLLGGRVGPARVGLVSAGERQDYVPVVEWGRIGRIRRDSVSSVPEECWWAARMLRAALGGVDAMVLCTMAWSDRCPHGQRMGQGRGTVGFCPGLKDKSGDFPDGRWSAAQGSHAAMVGWMP